MTIIRLYSAIGQVRIAKVIFLAERLKATFAVQIVFYDFLLEFLAVGSFNL